MYSVSEKTDINRSFLTSAVKQSAMFWVITVFTVIQKQELISSSGSSNKSLAR